MKTRGFGYLVMVFLAGFILGEASDQPAEVTQVMNRVEHGSPSTGSFSPAEAGTSVRLGEEVRTGVKSLAEIKLPTLSITRLGANTTFTYSVDSNEVDLQAGTILFSKPKGARELSIKTAAVTAGIVGTTGFVSVEGEGKKATYILGLIEGHTIAHADGHPFPLGAGDILQFTPGQKPFVFSFDVPRFVKSSSLLHKFSSQLPTQPAIDTELADYADDVSRGFIVPPSGAVNYVGAVPVLSTVAYSSAQNAQSQSSSKGGAPPPPPPSQPSSTYGGNGSLYNSTRH